MYYACHAMLWPEFIAEGMVGLNFCASALTIDEADKLSQKVSEHRHNFKLSKCIQMWSSK